MKCPKCGSQMIYSSQHGKYICPLCSRERISLCEPDYNCLGCMDFPCGKIYPQLPEKMREELKDMNLDKENEAKASTGESGVLGIPGGSKI